MISTGHRYPMGDAVEDYLAATNNKVYCTNRHGTIRVYAYANGKMKIYKQNKIDKSCVYDGSHY